LGHIIREPPANESKPYHPLVEQLVDHYYTDRHFADFRARRGEWDTAFEDYAKLAPEDRIRPKATDEVADTEIVINALCAHLHATVRKGHVEVKRLFVRGCQLVLGFSEVTFWRHDREWEPEITVDSDKPFTDCELYREILPDTPSYAPGILPSPHKYDHHVLIGIVPAIRSEEWSGVVVGRPDDPTVISRERRRLAHHLLMHFIEAYSHAIDIMRSRIRLRTREQYGKIVSDVFAELGSEVTDVGHALALAAQGLRKLGYRRVLFCLVDPTHTSVQGVLDDSADPSVDIARMTAWPLNKPMADVQPYVISTKQPKIIENAQTEPLTNKEVVKAAGLRAMAVVPLINQSGEAIGTIHVEREDRTGERFTS